MTLMHNTTHAKTLTLIAVMFLALSNTGCPGEDKQETAPKKKQAVKVGPGGKNVKPGQGPNGGNNNGGNEDTKTLAEKVEACVKKILVKGTPASEVKSLLTELETLITDNPGDVDPNEVVKVLQQAASHGKFVIIRLFSTLTFRNNGTLLHAFAEIGSKIQVENILKVEGTNVNAKDKYGQTPLHLTVANNNKEGVEALLAQGADVNAKNKDGQTTLHLAVRRGREILVKALLGAKDIDVNAKDKDGNTPLHLAAFNNNKDAMEALLKVNGIKVNAKDKDDNTPLDVFKAQIHSFIRNGEITSQGYIKYIIALLK